MQNPTGSNYDMISDSGSKYGNPKMEYYTYAPPPMATHLHPQMPILVAHLSPGCLVEIISEAMHPLRAMGFPAPDITSLVSSGSAIFHWT